MSQRPIARRLASIAKEYAKLAAELLDSLPPEESPVNTRFEKAILEAIGTDTMPAKKIARRSGYAYSARLRSTLAAMCRAGILTRSPDGYRRVLSQDGGKARASQE